MRLYDSIFLLHVRRESDRDRRRHPSRFPPAFQSQAYGVGVWRSALQSLFDGGLQFRRAVALEEAQQTQRERTEIAAACSGTQQELATGRSCRHEPIGCSVLTGLALVGNQRGDMRRVFDLRAAIVAAWVVGQERRAVEHADAFWSGAQREQAPNSGVRHAVIIKVEPYPRRTRQGRQGRGRAPATSPATLKECDFARR